MKFNENTFLIIPISALAKTQKSAWLMKERRQGEITLKHWACRGR